MVLVAFPLAKLGFLLLKQLSKPVANYIKNEAKKHPEVRKLIIVPTGRMFHKLYNISDKTAPKTPLSEADAVDLGSSALGEIVLFALLSIVLIFEIGRQSDKKATIQKTKDDEISSMKESISDLLDDYHALSKKLKFMEKQLKGTLSSMDLEEFRHIVVEDQPFEPDKYFENDVPDDSA